MNRYSFYGLVVFFIRRGLKDTDMNEIMLIEISPRKNLPVEIPFILLVHLLIPVSVHYFRSNLKIIFAECLIYRI